ncbi:hypothetical protein [Roseicyclus sp.]
MLDGVITRRARLGPCDQLEQLRHLALRRAQADRAIGQRRRACKEMRTV